MTNELTLYLNQLKLCFVRFGEVLDGLTEAQLNWKPPAPESNSIFIIATHVLGNAHGWVLGICCGQAIDRDRAAEFRAAGANAAPLIARANELGQQIEQALTALDPASLDDSREPRQRLWGAGTTRPVTGREALMHAIDHFSIHTGQIQITRDLVLAKD